MRVHLVGAIAAVVLVADSATPALATTIRNLTTGQLLFAADYEGNSTVSTADYPDTLGAYTPDAAVVGSWGAIGGANVQQTQVTNFASPGANEGENYLRLGRFAGNNPADSFPSAEAVPTAAQTTLGDVIRYETAQYISGVSGNNVYSRTILLQDDSGASIANVELGFDGKAYNRTGGSPTRVDSGLTFTPYAWQTFAVVWEIGASTYTIEIDGATSIPLNVWATGNNGTFGKAIVGGGNPSSSAGGTLQYYDAVRVPEPASLALLAPVAAAGALALRRRTKTRA